MMWDRLVQRFFGGRGSKDEAKDRLRIALMFDRMGISADRMEALRRDILKTISRHVEIVPDKVKIEFHDDRTRAALFINAPVRRTIPRAEDRAPSPPSKAKGNRAAAGEPA